LNSFYKKGIKHVRSAVWQIETIGKIHENIFILQYKAKINEIMFCGKKCSSLGRAALFGFFSEIKDIAL